MTRKIPRLSALERDMTHEHWLPNDSPHAYTWKGVDVDVVATHYNTTPSKVREIMKAIAAKYPPPNPDTNAELAKKSPTGDTCDKCGEAIVWIQFQPCNPKITRFIAADGNKYTGREDHRETCLPKTEGESRPVGIEASQIG